MRFGLGINYLLSTALLEKKDVKTTELQKFADTDINVRTENIKNHEEGTPPIVFRVSCIVRNQSGYHSKNRF